jgi:2-phosphosulfolactate phosphatase
MTYFDQSEYAVRFEWGLSGVQALAPASDLLIIVDVLSFTTCVDIVVGRGGFVYPYRDSLDALPAYAQARDALFAAPGRRHEAAYSLSPASLMSIPAGMRLVLPSPNGSTLSLSTAGVPAMAGCLRNAQAVAARAEQLGRRISVIAAGERWKEKSGGVASGRLRVALEDLLGAGAIISYLDGRRSPEAETAVAAFRSAESDLLDILTRCGSGKELIGRGFAADVQLAAQLNVSAAAPLLEAGVYS